MLRQFCCVQSEGNIGCQHEGPDVGYWWLEGLLTHQLSIDMLFVGSTLVEVAEILLIRLLLAFSGHDQLWSWIRLVGFFMLVRICS